MSSPGQLCIHNPYGCIYSIIHVATLLYGYFQVHKTRLSKWIYTMMMMMVMVSSIV